MLSCDGQVGVERVVLEDHRDVAVLRREVVDDAVADEIVPSVISSSPATMRSAVVLPQPDGPTSTRNSPSPTSSERSWTAWTRRRRPCPRHSICTSATSASSHRQSTLQAWNAGPSPGSDCLAAADRRVAAVQASRARRRRARPAAGARARDRRARRAQHASRRASRAGTRSRRRRRARSGCRPARAHRCGAAAHEPRYRRAAPCPTSRAAPGHRAPRVLAPVALEAELVAREDHRHAGARHLQADADELPLARAGDRAEPRGVVAVEQRPGVEHRSATGCRPGSARIVGTTASPGAAARRPAARGLRRGRSGRLVAAQPRPHGARETGVAHRAVPAAGARSARAVVACSATTTASPRAATAAARTPLATSAGRSTSAQAARHLGDVDPPPVERVRRLEPGGDRRGVAVEPARSSADGSRASAARGTPYQLA